MLRVIKRRIILSVCGFRLLNKPGCKTDCTHRLERRKRMAALSDSNPNTQKEGGGKLCPMVTPAERNERKQKQRGMVCEVPIFILTLQRKMHDICPND